MNATKIRSRNELSLYESLQERREVIEAREHIAELTEQGYFGVRRRLMATSVRLTRSMAKSVHQIADECAERLELELPLELFAYSSPQFNAACFSPEKDRLIIMLSSSLLESFAGRSLCFVVGHEVGHHVYRHHSIPIGFILNGKKAVGPRLALDLFSWSRYAEVSADRAGAHCAQDLGAVALALFRLASGLSDSVIDFNLEDFLSQVDEMQAADAEPGQGAPRDDWFSTHPFSPLRLKALKLFDESELARAGGISVDDLEHGVQNTMSLMDPSYLEGRTAGAESMRRLLFAGAIAIAQTSGEITESEIKVFEKFFGEGSFKSTLDIERLIAELPERIEQANLKTSVPERMQVMRDLCIVARSENRPLAAQRALLNRIAQDLGITRLFVEQACAGELDPD